MVIRINSGMELANKFKEYNRDQFSYDGYDALLDFYDEIDPNWELDVIEICVEWSEYGPDVDGSYHELFNEYGDYLDLDDYDVADTDELNLAIDEETIDVDDCLEGLVSVLEGYTTILVLENGDYIIGSF